MSDRVSDATLERLSALSSTNYCEASSYLSQLKEIVAEIDANKLIRMSTIFKALGDETRLKILHMLERRDMCVCELVAALGAAQPTMSHHLKVLEHAGLVARIKHGKWVFYGLKKAEFTDYLTNFLK